MCNIHGLLISLLQVREILLAPIRSILNEFALTEQQWRIISALANDDTVGLGPGQIAKRCCILHPSLTGILNRLERDGVVTREISNIDSRRQLIKLTARGRRLFLTINERMEVRYRLIEEVYGHENLQNVLTALHGLKD
ncbi:homoprotocatechuate degradation operon regulator HpaR [Burkholderia gladioli]|uniref:homoprotocatechuate degradation operon regulator HpaR n=1 Tax=Burkholderia gladioli TaxID=28095 RepID=UPI002FE36FBC